MTHLINIVDERQTQKPSVWKQVAVACVIAAALFGAGLLAKSAAIQWAGFVLFLVLIFAARRRVAGRTMTVEEAEKELQRISASSPKGEIHWV